MNIEHNQVVSSSISSLIRASVGLSVIALGLCGFIYSATATGLGQLLFPKQANGSLIIENERVIGSMLVAQPFVQAQYFQPRPSAAGYNPMLVSGSNMARTHPDLHNIVQKRLEQVSEQEQVSQSKIPTDLLTASGSGVDPDISVQSALIQVKRVAKARGLTEAEVSKILQQHTSPATFGILGNVRVNVLALNLALDQL